MLNVPGNWLAAAFRGGQETRTCVPMLRVWMIEVPTDTLLQQQLMMASTVSCSAVMQS